MANTHRNGPEEESGGKSGREIRRRRKAIWVVLSLAYLVVYFHRLSPAVIVNDLFSLFHIEAASMVGSLAAVYFYVYFLMQVPAGVLADLFGPRKIVFWGMSAAAAGSVWFGMSGSTAGLFGARFLIGLGVSVIFVALIRVYSAWFPPREFGSYLGLTLAVGNLGGLLAATPLAALVNSIGYRLAFVVVGLCSVLVAASSWLIVRNHPGEAFSPGQNFSSGGEPGNASWAEIYRNLLQIARSRHLWLALTASFSIYGPFMALAGVWGVPYLMQVYGLGRNEAASFNVVISAGLASGSAVMGILSDRLGSRKKPYLAYALGNVLVWALLVWWNHGKPPSGSLLVLYFLLGFFATSCVLSTVMVKEYNPPRVAGLASGIGNVGGFIGAAFMQPFFGYLLDLHWDGAAAEGVKLYSLHAFQYAFGVCFLVSCLAVAAISLLKESFKEDVYTPCPSNSGTKRSEAVPFP
ncbi:MAG: MFS transporter [Firmicutes bacterium]|nr:MFS transporter [Bacillota bacterium]